MQLDRFTQKSREAIQASLSLAAERKHAQVAPIHLLAALLRANDALVRRILDRIGASVDADVDAALAWLGERASSVGAAGHCTGGHLAFRAAFRPQVRATACWYATGLHDGKLGKDPDAGSLARAGEIQGELLTVWGTADPHTPQDGREVIRAGLAPLGDRLTWREYDAEHAFGRDVGDRYDPAVTDAAFAETIAVFGRAL